MADGAAIIPNGIASKRNIHMRKWKKNTVFSAPIMTKKDIQILFDIKFSALSEKKERAKKDLYTTS